MKEIKYFYKNGKLDHIEELNEDNLGNTNGMLVKCYMKNGNEEVGFSNPFKTYNRKVFHDIVEDYIYIWTWDYVNEETHQLFGPDEIRYNKTYKKVIIEEIKNIDAMLYSSPRWNDYFTNRFEFDKDYKIINSEEVVTPYFFKKYDNPEFVYNDDKYDIIGFIASDIEFNEYPIENVIGKKSIESWIFNINDKLLLINNTGNFSLDQYSAVVINNKLHIITDFNYYIVNLDNLKLENQTELDSSPFNEIYKFYNGIVLIGEQDIVYIENDKIIWTYSSSAIIDYVLVCSDDTIEVIETEPYSKFTLDDNGIIL